LVVGRAGALSRNHAGTYGPHGRASRIEEGTLGRTEGAPQDITAATAFVLFQGAGIDVKEAGRIKPGELGPDTESARRDGAQATPVGGAGFKDTVQSLQGDAISLQGYA